MRRRARFSSVRGAFCVAKHSAMLKLHVIGVSTREGRVGFPIVQWFVERAKAHQKFEVTLVDLKEQKLPLFDEPKHPRFKQYEHAHTKAWSAIVDAADAFVFVTPEYDYSAPPSLLNAVTYLFQEWAYKPSAFCSYGGISAGTRGVQVSKGLLSAVKAVPIPETVAIPMFATQIENGVFKSNDIQEKAVVTVLAVGHRWATALKPMRG